MKNEQKQTEPSRYDRTDDRIGNDPLPHDKETVTAGRHNLHLDSGRKGKTQRSEHRLEDDHKNSPEEI